MLVLSRRPGESIVIGGGIEVRVCKVEGEVVRLSIVAPREVAIYRKELFDEIRQSNCEAALKSKQGAALPRVLPALPLKRSILAEEE